MAGLTDERLAELERLHAESNGGEWFSLECGTVVRDFKGDPSKGGISIFNDEDTPEQYPHYPTTAFVIAAHTAVPDLVAEVRRLRAELAAERERAAGHCDRIAAAVVARAEADPLTEKYDLSYRQAARNAAVELRDAALAIREGG